VGGFVISGNIGSGGSLPAILRKDMKSKIMCSPTSCSSTNTATLKMSEIQISKKFEIIIKSYEAELCMMNENKEKLTSSDFVSLIKFRWYCTKHEMRNWLTLIAERIPGTIRNLSV